MPLLLPTKQVVIMFILMFVGWICYQVKFLHEQTVKDLTKILLYVVSPCLIINSFRQSFSVTRLVQFSLIFLLRSSINPCSIRIVDIIKKIKLVGNNFVRNNFVYEIILFITKGELIV